MDRMLASEAGDTGSIPVESATALRKDPNHFFDPQILAE
jgi:hypothetical protein